MIAVEFFYFKVALIFEIVFKRIKLPHKAADFGFSLENHMWEPLPIVINDLVVFVFSLPE